MSPIVSPTRTPTGTPPRDERPSSLSVAAGGDILIPHVLLQLEDDLERSHRREAAWISVAVHIFALIFLLLSPKIFGYQRVILANPADMMKDKQLTYLDMPPDQQTPPKQVRPDAKLSDKNRIAESRHPSVDQKTLEELRKAGPPQPPGQQTPPAQQSSPNGMQAPPQPTQQAQSMPPVQDPEACTAAAERPETGHRFSRYESDGRAADRSGRSLEPVRAVLPDRLAAAALVATTAPDRGAAPALRAISKYSVTRRASISGRISLA